jgi:hypothetical protein
MNESEKPSGKMLVKYEPLSADGVKELQATVVENEAWDHLDWGTYGPEGKGPKETKKLAELDTDHLEAILITQPHLGNYYRATILALLQQRYAG